MLFWVKKVDHMSSSIDHIYSFRRQNTKLDHIDILYLVVFSTQTIHYHIYLFIKVCFHIIKKNMFNYATTLKKYIHISKDVSQYFQYTCLKECSFLYRQNTKLISC